MINKYSDLYLEKVVIPNNYLKIVEEDGQWENDDFLMFSLYILEQEDGICYSCDIFPSDDEELDAKLEQKGYEVTGYGWEEYLFDYIKDNRPEYIEFIKSDSELGTCGLYTMELSNYRLLLQIVSEAVRNLFVTKV